MKYKEYIKKNVLLFSPRKILLCRKLYRAYKRINHGEKMISFIIKHWRKIYIGKKRTGKAKQIDKLLKKVTIAPVKSKEGLFYSVDCFKCMQSDKRVFYNYSIDYSEVVNDSLKEKQSKLLKYDSEFAQEELILIEALQAYVQRVKKQDTVSKTYKKAIDAIDSLFERPANSFFEGLQRILFYNQILWQTGHTLNGLGRLDIILGDLYEKDIKEKKLSRHKAKELVKDFMSILHEFYWFKSLVMLGDTGQIIVLGGMNSKGDYQYNDLTEIFIEASEELKLPDPKILLRCSKKMPEKLLEAALQCMATGIGTPLLSNDDVIVPLLKEYGYDIRDAYNYVTSACWEPLIASESCDQNNMAVINFATPLQEMLETEDLTKFVQYNDLLNKYESYLQKYVGTIMARLTNIEFEIDPMVSLVSKAACDMQKDITRGGAKYSNIGLTSVGMGTVINSMLNLREYVFEKQEYTLEELNEYRINNYIDCDEVIEKLKGNPLFFGTDEEVVYELVNYVSEIVSKEIGKFKTKYDGNFKFGFSAPGYLTEGKNTKATFDGRKAGEPFSVHISSSNSIAPTELISFATKLDYSGNRINGNVVDYFVAPHFLKANMNKFILLLKAGIENGIYQLQMNVVDSKTLIEAKNNPEKFPDLIVRVWGFSAYFNDLSEEYKDVLIGRALESEKVSNVF